MGLLAGENDVALVDRTGVGRDINRHYYGRDEIRAALKRPVVDNLLALIRLRNELPGFDGEFSLPSCSDAELRMRWTSAEGTSELQVAFPERDARIISRRGNTTRSYRVGETLEEI